MHYHVETRVRSLFNYYGSKVHLCRRILGMAPDHEIYVECFAGSLSVLLNKHIRDREVVCDVHEELINFLQVMVDQCEKVIELMQGIKVCEETYLEAEKAGKQGDELTRAMNFLCRQQMSFSGRKGWAGAAKKWREARWKTLPYDLRIGAKRLKKVQILLGSALNVIPQHDSLDTLYYCDPPYYGESRTNSGDDYLHELDPLDHVNLLRMLSKLEGHVILSGYDHHTYNKELAEWDRYEIEVSVNSSNLEGGKPRKMEVLWVKPSGRRIF